MISSELFRNSRGNENQTPDIPFFGESANALLKLLELPGIPFETAMRAA